MLQNHQVGIKPMTPESAHEVRIHPAIESARIEPPIKPTGIKPSIKPSGKPVMEPAGDRTPRLRQRSIT